MCCNTNPKIRWLKKKKAIDPWNRLLDICWGTRTRTRKGRTRICSVTITPYPNHYVLYWNFIALKSCLCWGTRTRTRKGRTRICSVTITPYPNRVYFKDALLKYGCKSTSFCNICQIFRLFFIKIFFLNIALGEELDEWYCEWIVQYQNTLSILWEFHHLNK